MRREMKSEEKKVEKKRKLSEMLYIEVEEEIPLIVENEHKANLSCLTNPQEKSKISLKKQNSSSVSNRRPNYKIRRPKRPYSKKPFEMDKVIEKSPKEISVKNSLKNSKISSLISGGIGSERSGSKPKLEFVQPSEFVRKERKERREHEERMKRVKRMMENQLEVSGKKLGGLRLKPKDRRKKLQ